MAQIGLGLCGPGLGVGQSLESARARPLATQADADTVADGFPVRTQCGFRCWPLAEVGGGGPNLSHGTSATQLGKLLIIGAEVGAE